MPLTPNNREEHWLQGMVDGSTTLEPNKRREYWYKEIVDAIGSGGGGGGDVLAVSITKNNDVYYLDKTWAEIYTALKNNKIVCGVYEPMENAASQVNFIQAYYDHGDYWVLAILNNSELEFTSETTDGVLSAVGQI